MKKHYLLTCFLFITFLSFSQTAFITTWEVTDGDLEITIPRHIDDTYVYNYNVNFGDGTIINNNTQSLSHTYNSPGIYTVEITGVFPSISFGNSNYNNAIKLKSIEQWGNIQWETMNFAFNNCANLTINAVDTPNLSQVSDMSYMFYKALNFNQSINQWDVSNVTNMNNLFRGATSFNQPLDNWNVSNVTEMSRMFYGALSFNQPINNWDVSSVYQMSYMFAKDENTPSNQPGLIFNQPLLSWDVSNVSSMRGMFAYTESFNQPLDSWNVSNVSNMDEMFQGAKAFNQSLNSWNLSNIFSVKRMFFGAINFNGAIGNWDVSNITDMSYLFSYATTFNQPLDSWDVSNVTTMYGMFRFATSFNQPLNNWDVSNVELLTTMFEDASSFNQPLDNWDVSSVKEMYELFKNATAFNGAIGTWDVTAIGPEQDVFGNGIANMFYGASSFNQPLNSWDVSNFTSLRNLFTGASAFNQPLDNWDVTNITLMQSVFMDALAFNQALDNWNVTNVTNMSSMFNGASSFNQPLSNWNVSNISNMASMFRNASNFNQPLDTWNIVNVSSLSNVFNGANAFNQDISNWNVSNVSTFSYMFKDATSFNQILSNWDYSNISNPNVFTGLYEFVSGSGLSTENYDLLLQHLTTFNKSNFYLGATDLTYCNQASRDMLEINQGWTIYGDSQAQDCNTLEGTVFYDIDNNGCTTGDISNTGFFVNVNDGSSNFSQMVSNSTYEFGLTAGNYDVSLNNAPNYISVTPQLVNVIFPASGDQMVADFCLTANQTVNDLNITLLPLSEARPGFEAQYQLVIENIGTQSINNINANLAFDDTKQTFVSAMPIQTSATANSLDFTIASLNPFDKYEIDILMQTFAPPTVNGDDVLNFTASVSPNANDYTPNDNTFILDQIVVNSYDPNDIRVLQGNTITTDETSEYLDYIIRFQNTGSASAINVNILSDLDPKLDISTLKITNSSHIFKAEVNDYLLFTFDNINLPAETQNEPLSHGFIAYKIKPISTIQVGDFMSGDAAIFFDFNPPIITNTVSTEVINNLSVEEFSLQSIISLYPNPTDKGVFIKTKDGVIINSVKLYNIQGTALINRNTNLEYIDTEDIASGMYIFAIETNKGNLIEKLVIE